MTQSTSGPVVQWSIHRQWSEVRKRFGLTRYAAIAVAVLICIWTAVFVAHALSPAPPRPGNSSPVRYLGVYEPDAPTSYAGIEQFSKAIGRQPNIVPYYSHWLNPFAVGFATMAAKHGAITLVQIAPQHVSLESIASGQYDAYLRAYALAVKSFGNRVVLSFGHEMNGNWYSWGFQHTPSDIFIAAWRHIVNVFREVHATNVTWLWTVNIVGSPDHAPDPAPWWPGQSYVNWVGIDGYYRNASAEFASVFGPTIADVRELTHDPILIAETAAEPSSAQPAKISDLFAGVRTFGLLGFIWFDRDDVSVGESNAINYWHLSSPAALATFRRDAKVFMRSPTPPSPIHSQP